MAMACVGSVRVRVKMEFSRIQFVLYTPWKGMNSYFLLLPQQQGIVDSLTLSSK